jgi:hypothetical protein
MCSLHVLYTIYYVKIYYKLSVLCERVMPYDSLFSFSFFNFYKQENRENLKDPPSTLCSKSTDLKSYFIYALSCSVLKHIFFSSYDKKSVVIHIDYRCKNLGGGVGNITYSLGQTLIIFPFSFCKHVND